MTFSSSSQGPHIILLGSLGVFEPMCQMIRRKKTENIKKSHKGVAKRQRMAKEYSTIHTLQDKFGEFGDAILSFINHDVFFAKH